MTSDGKNCYTYNDANQLSQVKDCGNNQVIAEYVYDYQGNRVTKKVYSNGSLQKTVYSPNKEYETVKLASNGQTSNTSYYIVNDSVAAKKNPDGNKNYYLSDNLGSTSVLTNQSGTVVESSTYYPFGQIRSGGTQTKQLYTGQENDSETNLDYYNARYYNPDIMHFTQADTLLPNVYDPQQLNRYSYVRNNPLRYTDPSGHGVLDALLSFAIRIASLVSIISKIQNVATKANPNTVQQAPKAVQVVNKVQSNPVVQNVENKASNIVSRVANNPVAQKTESMAQNTEEKVHGNSLNSTRQTVGYYLRDKTDQTIKKIGETMAPDGRYSQKWLDENNVYMDSQSVGSKAEMRVWEHEQIGNYLENTGDFPIWNYQAQNAVNVFR